MSGAGERERLIAVDHPEQRLVAKTAEIPGYLRVDPTHELPLILTDARGRPVARFRSAHDAAALLQAREQLGWRLTLPAPIVEDMKRLAVAATVADLPAMLRNAGAQ